MMEVKQKINLYLPRFQPAKLSKEVRTFILSISLVLGMLTLLIITLFIINSIIKADVMEKKSEELILNTALTQAISKNPNINPDTNLISHITKEKQAIKKKQQVINYLYQDTINEGESFTSQVDQLAQINMQEVWLKKFEILNNGYDIQLFGYIKKPSFISKFIGMLGDQESYKGKRFQQIKVNKSKDGLHDFYISTLSFDELSLLESLEAEQ